MIEEQQRVEPVAVLAGELRERLVEREQRVEERRQHRESGREIRRAERSRRIDRARSPLRQDLLAAGAAPSSPA